MLRLPLADIGPIYSTGSIEQILFHAQQSQNRSLYAHFPAPVPNFRNGFPHGLSVGSVLRCCKGEGRSADPPLSALGHHVVQPKFMTSLFGWLKSNRLRKLSNHACLVSPGFDSKKLIPHSQIICFMVLPRKRSVEASSWFS